MNQGQGFARRATIDNLPVFAPLLRQAADQLSDQGGSDDEGASRTPTDPAYEEAENLFQGNSLRAPMAFHRPASERWRQPSFSEPAQSQEQEEPQVVPTPMVRGPVVWRKTLAASDVQRQPGHATGGLRLTQARFTLPDGNRIDQTTYFRDTLFGNSEWTELRAAPNRREGAVIEFALTVLGEDWGTHNLTVSHKPSGEAGQGNYTTILHWGDLSARVYEANLVSRELIMFAPASDTNEPFFIEIS